MWSLLFLQWALLQCDDPLSSDSPQENIKLDNCDPELWSPAKRHRRPSLLLSVCAMYVLCFHDSQRGGARGGGLHSGTRLTNATGSSRLGGFLKPILFSGAAKDIHVYCETVRRCWPGVGSHPLTLTPITCDTPHRRHGGSWAHQHYKLYTRSPHPHTRGYSDSLSNQNTHILLNSYTEQLQVQPYSFGSNALYLHLNLFVSHEPWLWWTLTVHLFVL